MNNLKKFLKRRIPEVTVLSKSCYRVEVGADSENKRLIYFNTRNDARSYKSAVKKSTSKPDVHIFYVPVDPESGFIFGDREVW